MHARGGRGPEGGGRVVGLGGGWHDAESLERMRLVSASVVVVGSVKAVPS